MEGALVVVVVVGGWGVQGTGIGGGERPGLMTANANGAFCWVWCNTLDFFFSRVNLKSNYCQCI